MRFKQRYLRGGGGSPSSSSASTLDRLRIPAYRFRDAFVSDLENGCVRFGFHCLIPGSIGKGTQFVYFDTEGKVRT